jgi:tetratricopeptide (TPR) repeat protein
MTLVVFAVFFLLYAFSLGPALAPYRDAGELASAAATLSVAHPTSYPAYVLLGRLWERLPLGNPAYRLALLSAAAAAAACAVVALAARRRWGFWPAAGAAVLLGLDGTLWSVAQAQEMYSLGVLGAAALLAAGLSLSEEYDGRLWLALCYGLGLTLANRLDALLLAPGLVWLALARREETRSPLWASAALVIVPAAQVLLSANWPIVPLIAATAWTRAPREDRSTWMAVSAVAGAAGLSLYLFLPVRSAGGPWLDWNHPVSWPNFVDSLLRTRYGGTLDLISRNYKTGELALDNARLYGLHLWSAFGPVGLAAVAWGCVAAARSAPRRWLGQLACWWWAGPVFLFMANMPPNPHAAAILEPHYLLGDVVLVFWAAEGLGAAGAAAAWAGPAALAGVAAFAVLTGVPGRYARRAQYFGQDFVRGVLRGAPPGAVVVAKKDVPLYALWSAQTLEGRRPDLRFVAQGLAGSPWYQADWRRRDPSLSLVALSDAASWKRLAALNGAVLATSDAELPGEIAGASKPRGLLYDLSPSAEPRPLWWTLDAARGEYDYDAQPDFFTSDLVDERAQALARLGAGLALAGRFDEARPFLLRAWSMHWLLPEPAVLLGYSAFSQGRLDEARRHYRLAQLLSDELLVLAARYRALPAVTAGIRRLNAEAVMHQGVAAQRQGKTEDAERLLTDSLARVPSAQAHYNLAVLYWERDRARVEAELRATLALDPGHAEAARYLQTLRSGVSSTRQRR